MLFRSVSQSRYEQQQALTDIQIAGNKELANHGMGISKKMFEATGYKAQRRQMEEAGLNPALMYGKAGGGGTTQAVGAGSVAGALASDEASQKQAAIQAKGMGLQIKQQRAQIQLIEAQADRERAAAEATRGYQRDLAEVNIRSVLQDIQNKEVQRLGMNLQNEYDAFRNLIQQQTVNFTVDSIRLQAEKLGEEFRLLHNSRYISDSTKDSLIEQQKLIVRNLSADLIVKQTQQAVNREQALKIANDILVSWEEVELSKRELDIADQRNRIVEAYPSLQELGGAAIQDLFQKLRALIQGARGFTPQVHKGTELPRF